MNADLGIDVDDSEMHPDPFAMDMQCPPYEAPPPPYSPPKPSLRIHTTDAPPPYNVLEDLENNNQCPVREIAASQHSPSSELTLGSLFNHDRTRPTVDLDESARIEERVETACCKREGNMPRHTVINDALLRNFAQTSCETSPESLINSSGGHILPQSCGDMDIPEEESSPHHEQAGERAINLSDHSQTCVKLSLSVCDSSHDGCLPHSANAFNSTDKLSLVTLSYLSPESLADQYVAKATSQNNSTVSPSSRLSTVSLSLRKNNFHDSNMTESQASSEHNLASTSALAKGRCNSEPVTSDNCKYIKSILNPNHIRCSMDPLSVPHRSSTLPRTLGVVASPRPVRISYVEFLDEPHHSSENYRSNCDCETSKHSSYPKKKLIMKDSKDIRKYTIQNNSESMTASIDLSCKPQYASSPKVTTYDKHAINKEGLASSVTRDGHGGEPGASYVSLRQSHVQVSPIHDLPSPVSVNPLPSMLLEDNLRSDLIAPAVSLTSICSETGEKRLSRIAMTKADSPNHDSKCNSNVWSTLVNSSVNAANISSPKEVANVPKIDFRNSSKMPLVNADVPKKAKFQPTSDCCNGSVLTSVELLGNVQHLHRRPLSTEIRSPEWKEETSVILRHKVNKREKHRNKRFSTGCMPPNKLRKTNVTRNDVITGYAHLLPVAKESSHQKATATNYRRHHENLRRMCNDIADNSIKDYGFVDDMETVGSDQTWESSKERNDHAKPLHESPSDFHDKVCEVYATNQRNRSNAQRKMICKSNSIKRKLHEGILDNEVNNKRTYKELIYSKRTSMSKADCPKEESSRCILPKTISNEKTPKYLHQNTHEDGMPLSEWDSQHATTTFRLAPKEPLEKADLQITMTSPKNTQTGQNMQSNSKANNNILPRKQLPSAGVIMLPAHLVSPESNISLPTVTVTDKRWNLQNCSYV